MTAVPGSASAMPFSDRGWINLSDAAALADKVTRHLEEHGARVERAGNRFRLSLDFSSAELEASPARLDIRIAAADSSLLHEVRMLLQEHLLEFAEQPAGRVEWKGYIPAAGVPPNFRLMRVVAARAISPHMRRVTLAGDDLLRFSGSRHFHCKLLIPPTEIEAQWPSLDADGRFVWPDGPGRPIVRKYTIRSVDLAASTLDIDFVLHDVPGPGASWAAAARPGDCVGLVGPGGRAGIPADRCLLAGDETALPFLSRIAETLPAGTKALLLVEVADAFDELAVTSAAELEIRWLHRHGAPAGTTRLLEDAIRATDWLGDAQSASAVVGCEQEAALAIRKLLRGEKGLAAERQLVVPYWRRGVEG